MTLTESIGSVDEWAERINARWRDSVDAIIDVGRMLLEAKASCDHGEFTDLLERRLVFKPNTAQRLMAIAQDERLTNPARVQVLPNSWGTLYELTKLDDFQLEAKFQDGTIRPEMQRQEITTEIKQRHRDQRERDLGEKIAALPSKRYGVILADPEWRFEPWSRSTGMDRAADNHYATSTVEEIASRDVASISYDDCVLFLWVTVPMLPAGLYVMERWGFTYQTNIVWCKEKIGTGYWFRNRHELLLVGTKGKPVAPAMGTQWDSVARPRDPEHHSEKPQLFRKIIEAYYPTTPKIELNAADEEEWPGWARWGAPHRKASVSG